MKNKTIFIIFVFLAVAISVANQKKASKPSNRVDEFVDEYSRQAENECSFLRTVFEILDNKMEVGQNKLYEADKESIIEKNGYGDVIKLALSPKFYVAKEYLAQSQNLLKDLAPPTARTKEIKDNLLNIIRLRIEGIDYLTKGYLLREQIGKISMANTLSAIKGGTTPAQIPTYNGEVEEGIAKMMTSYTYYADTLRKIINVLRDDDVKEINAYETSIGTKIGNYSEISEADLEQILKEGTQYLDNSNYFESLICFYKANKIKPDRRDILLGLAKSYKGLNNDLYLIPIMEKADKLFPNDLDFLALKDK